MLKTSPLAVCTLIFSALVLSSPRASGQTAQSYQCQTVLVVPGTAIVTHYVSDVFQSGAHLPEINLAWKDYIAATYHIGRTGSCIRLGNSASVQAYMDAEERALALQNQRVIRVKWMYTPGTPSAGSAASLYSAAPSPPGIGEPNTHSATPPVASGGSEPSASYCYSDDSKPTIYFSDAFDTAGLPSSAAWSAAFSKMLAQKYAYKGTVTCKTVTTIVSAQSAMREQRDALQGKQFVDTDWTYEPPAPTQ
jgi:hypothetical protein